MADPIRTRILREVGNLLGQISSARSVRQAQAAGRNEATLPAIVYYPGKETVGEDQMDAAFCSMDLVVETYGREETSMFEEAHRWMADVVEALWRDCTLGGYAFSITETDNQVYAGDIAEPVWIAQQTFQVFYRHSIGNWETQ